MKKLYPSKPGWPDTTLVISHSKRMAVNTAANRALAPEAPKQLETQVIHKVRNDLKGAEHQRVESRTSSARGCIPCRPCRTAPAETSCSPSSGCRTGLWAQISTRCPGRRTSAALKQGLPRLAPVEHAHRLPLQHPLHAEAPWALTTYGSRKWVLSCPRVRILRRTRSNAGRTSARSLSGRIESIWETPSKERGAMFCVRAFARRSLQLSLQSLRSSRSSRSLRRNSTRAHESYMSPT